MKIPLPFTLFRHAGATAQVFLIKGGKAENVGRAWSGFIGLRTTVAVVPTTPIVLNFNVDARTLDNQPVTVTGTVTVTLDPDKAREAFDTAVDPVTGAYRVNWQRQLQDAVFERTLAPIRASVKQINVLAALGAQPEIEAALAESVKKDEALAALGVRVGSVTVANVQAGESVVKAAGAKELQAMLTEADLATHERRTKAAENERQLKTLEAETAQKLEIERGKLVLEKAKNDLAQAEADAKATEARLKPFAEAKPENVLGAAILKMAEEGVTNLTISPDILAVLRGGAGQ